MSEEEKGRAMRSGSRPPKPWNRDSWIATHKRKKIRPQPYATAAAADECAELARRAGWECVQVVELRKGNAP